MAETQQQLQVRDSMLLKVITKLTALSFRTQMRSVRAFFREEVERKKIIVAQELTPADEEAEYQRCSAINDEWNLEISKRRDARLIKENAERREHILRRLEAKKVRDQDELEKMEIRVRQEKENSATFITADNIDKAIEHALANQVDYNFSIDLQGNIYRGNARPGDKKEVNAAKPIETVEAGC